MRARGQIQKLMLEKAKASPEFFSDEERRRLAELEPQAKYPVEEK